MDREESRYSQTEKKPNECKLKGGYESKHPAFCKDYSVPRQQRDGSARAVGTQPGSGCPHAWGQYQLWHRCDQIPSLPQILKVLLMRFNIKRHCQEHLVPPREALLGLAGTASAAFLSSGDKFSCIPLSSLLTHTFLGRTEAKQNAFT